ncbi:hypothetical protein OXPF_26100 [Oxobacter pfennigii]|uniref:Uncharacterized protein n=1 Tax=Oxobacter pfennigii TaxID=36849 RepID=A0A0P8W564_9CLOT|nr:hypothetical protein [Oxobacter pfennigii]KPU43750.1 hypothetical protein OXPF_26100 [Oxobacter pfennigii]
MKKKRFSIIIISSISISLLLSIAAYAITLTTKTVSMNASSSSIKYFETTGYDTTLAAIMVRNYITVDGDKFSDWTKEVSNTRTCDDSRTWPSDPGFLGCEFVGKVSRYYKVNSGDRDMTFSASQQDSDIL